MKNCNFDNFQFITSVHEVKQKSKHGLISSEKKQKWHFIMQTEIKEVKIGYFKKIKKSMVVLESSQKSI